MNELIDWAYNLAYDYLPDLELNGEVDADDLVCFLSDKYCNMYGKCTTQEVRDVLMIVALDLKPADV
jgi:hypothetical protein